MRRGDHAYRVRVRRWLVAAALAFLSLSAAAGTLSRTNVGGFEVRGSGKTWTFGNAKPMPGDVGWLDVPGATARTGPYGFFEDAAGPMARSRANLALPNSGGRYLPVDVLARVPRSSAAAAIGKFARNGIPVLGTALAAYTLMQDLGFLDGGDPDGDGFVNWMKFDDQDPFCGVAPCYEYHSSTFSANGTGNMLWRESRALACLQAFNYNQSINSSWAWRDLGVVGGTDKGPDFGLCKREFSTNGGASWQLNQSVIEARTRAPDTGEPALLPASEQDLVDRIAAQSGWPSRSTLALAEALEAGQSVTHDAPTVSGPSQVQGQSQTKSEPIKKADGTPGTKVSTTNTTFNNTYNNNVVTTTVTTVTNVVITYEDGTTETETTTEEKEPEQPEDVCKEHPDRVECKELGDAPDEEVPRKEVAITYEEENLGLGGGACPAPFAWHDSLGNHAIDLAPYCDKVATVIKPLVLAFAALTCLFILMPGRTEG